MCQECSAEFCIVEKLAARMDCSSASQSNCISTRLFRRELKLGRITSFIKFSISILVMWVSISARLLELEHQGAIKRLDMRPFVLIMLNLNVTTYYQILAELVLS